MLLSSNRLNNAHRNYKQKQARERPVSAKEIHKMQASNQQLLEENNVLKAKNDILIEMISEVYSEFKLENDKKAKRKH